MSKINELHEQAMEASDEAFFARRQGDMQTAETFARQAFELERAAADLVYADSDAEPTRSVLYRSAASMAIDCKEFREAERLLAIAMAGNPPDDVLEELRELFEYVHTFLPHNGHREKSESIIEVTGRLVFADALKTEKEIKLKRGDDQPPYTVIVPEGVVMNDIVRPLWDDIVVVKGIQHQDKLYLKDIYKRGD